MMNCDQEEITLKTIAAKIPGAASGRMIKSSDCTRPQPSIRAASSSSEGIESKNPFSSHTVKGICTVIKTRITDAWVSRRPSWLK